MGSLGAFWPMEKHQGGGAWGLAPGASPCQGVRAQRLLGRAGLHGAIGGRVQRISLCLLLLLLLQRRGENGSSAGREGAKDAQREQRGIRRGITGKKRAQDSQRAQQKSPNGPGVPSPSPAPAWITRRAASSPAAHGLGQMGADGGRWGRWLYR